MREKKERTCQSDYWDDLTMKHAKGAFQCGLNSGCNHVLIRAGVT